MQKKIIITTYIIAGYSKNSQLHNYIVFVLTIAYYTTNDQVYSNIRNTYDVQFVFQIGVKNIQVLKNY